MEQNFELAADTRFVLEGKKADGKFERYLDSKPSEYQNVFVCIPSKDQNVLRVPLSSLTETELLTLACAQSRRYEQACNDAKAKRGLKVWEKFDNEFLREETQKPNETTQLYKALREMDYQFSIESAKQIAERTRDFEKFISNPLNKGFFTLKENEHSDNKIYAGHRVSTQMGLITDLSDFGLTKAKGEIVAEERELGINSDGFKWADILSRFDQAIARRNAQKNQQQDQGREM